jgi:LysR family transcriptional regulator, nitrogen assimilation regulatory protein
LNIRQLEYFVRVAELGSFTRAAATLRVSQPVLSRQVRQLELELKTHLLFRNGHGVTPTENGRRLVAHGKGILHQVDLAKLALREQEASPAGKVSVGLPPSVGKQMTVRLVSNFRTQYPRAALGIVEGLTSSLHEWLLTGRLDIALLYNPPPTPQLAYEHAWSEKLYLISATDRKMPARVRIADLARYPLIIPSRPNALRNLIEAECGRKNVALDIILEIDAITSVLDLVERGVGYAILTRNAVQDRVATNAIQATPIVGPGITSHLYIATAAQRPMTRLARHTINLIRTEFSRRGPSAAGAQPATATSAPG